MEDAFKGFVKKLNNPFASSSSSRFKGEGRRLGSGETRSDNYTDRKNQSRSNEANEEDEKEARRIRAHEERWGRAERGSNQSRVSGPVSSSMSSVPEVIDGKSKFQEGSYEVSLLKAFQDQSIRVSVEDSSLERNGKETAARTPCDVSTGVENEQGNAFDGNLMPFSLENRADFDENKKKHLASNETGNESVQAIDGNTKIPLPSNDIDNELGQVIEGNMKSSLAGNSLGNESVQAIDGNTKSSLPSNDINSELRQVINGNMKTSLAGNSLDNELGKLITVNTSDIFSGEVVGNEGENASNETTGTLSVRNREKERSLHIPFDADKSEGESGSGFDPYSSLIGSKLSSVPGDSLKPFQCPVCGSFWRTENEVNTHVDKCLQQSSSPSTKTRLDIKTNALEESKISLGVFLSGGPSNDTINVMLKILQNVINNPEVEKYRKIRLGNQKIHSTIGTALGGVELLMAMGFDRIPEENEVWAVMATPSSGQLEIMKGIISELEDHLLAQSKGEETSEDTEKVHRKVDRQVRVFYSVSENLAARMDVPDSFYNLSAAELRQEAASRRKKLEDSQLLISRVSREKANNRRYKAAIIRIQFPDGVVLQGTFMPWEPTSAIYEFVASTLRNPAIQFDLIAPILRKNQIVPSFSQGPIKVPTLEEANLVPATLMKFKCSESDSLTFTGLHPDFLTLMEPLSTTTMHS